MTGAFTVDALFASLRGQLRPLVPVPGLLESVRPAAIVLDIMLECESLSRELAMHGIRDALQKAGVGQTLAPDDPDVRAGGTPRHG